MARFKGLLSNKSANLIVVRCRRRIGKSRLLAEFRKEIKSYFFSGNPLAPKVTAQSQRLVFVKQLERNGIPGVQPDDWGYGATI
jgi:AAA+ ATPase superfamily predicted ATPase